MAICAHCNGKGTIRCPDCAGVGTRAEAQLDLLTGRSQSPLPCPKCKGTGTVACPACEASGEVEDDDD
jgi:DnaJ-class molecular chaperone